ncbi:hypothetical protein [Polymorphobacter megasporae]|uniref:hypothetical protein n=1 Tax=Glacieibacterium megasporae TaxID=2835787 RepID=UPI001C1E6591|nr:hypothetical protein [Polymorphobacter megasporae]UAJ10201.1 hypothetical protein KTC28_00015 [Polymorphobacter megasporae]
MTETPEARTRRRWITMGEIIGIAALVISGLSYWDAHEERVAPPKPPTAAPAKEKPLVLTGTLSDAHDRIELHPASADDVIQTQTIRFPTSVRADAVDTTGNARIEAAWFESGLRAALKGTKLHAGRHRLALGIETSYVAGDATRTDRAVYDIGYTLHERLLRSDAVAIEGVSLVRRAGDDLQAAVDARFAAQLPKPAAEPEPEATAAEAKPKSG